MIDIEGIGPIAADSVILFLENRGNIEEIHQLLKLGVNPKTPNKKRLAHRFSGKTFVLTGTLSQYTRSQATAMIKERGGKVAGSVSAKTDFLLAGESPGSKYDRAKKLGVEILSELDFQKSLS